jgi:hypothetical protein
VEEFFNTTLGPGVYNPEVNEYCKKLRSATQAHGHEPQQHQEIGAELIKPVGLEKT